MMNLLFNGPPFLLASLSTPFNTRSRSSISFGSNHFTVDREIWTPFWIPKLTALSTTTMSPRLEKAGMTEETVENDWA
jgi:hypothetical protein